MDKKLKEYRRRQKKKELLQNAQNMFKKLFKGSKKDAEEALDGEVYTYMELRRRHVQQNEQSLPKENVSDNHEEPKDDSEDCPPAFQWKRTIVISLLWIVAYTFFIYVQFGAVFFVISIMVTIYYNTRTRPRKKGEISAYSVFNENCVAIDGTLKAEQFDKELRQGMLW